MGEFLCFKSQKSHTHIISFSKENDYLRKITFYHLIQYCKSKPSTIIAKAQKVSANTAGIQYKFGIQVPKGIKNEVNLDKKKCSNIWEETI
jgi:hypothetical protein